jgi:curved DNA-binding protein CbpA
MRTYYEILGVNNLASQSEIKDAYRRLALRLHPDKNKNSEESKQRFVELVEAFNILSDEQLRREYDVSYHSDVFHYPPEQKRTTIDYALIGFVLYERRDLGIRIQYPSDWIMDEKKRYNPYDDRFAQVLGLLIPAHHRSDQLQEIVSIEIRYLGSDRIDFEAYTNRQIKTLMTRHTNAFDFILLESSQTTLAGRRAHMVDYIYTYKRNNRYLRSIEFWTIERGRSYHISYETYSLDYLTLLPVIQKMITSFQILS